MSDAEEEYNPKSHKNLLQAISNIGKAQHIRISTRDEPQSQRDEFHLIKKAPVKIDDIAQILKKTKKHLDAGKQLKNASGTRKVLRKPLEKNVTERIKRVVGYEEARKRLERWDAIVAKNRSSETQVFPLQSETVYVDTSAYSKPFQLAVKSDLMLELESTEAKLKELKKARSNDNENDEDVKEKQAKLLEEKLTRDELMARRKELAYLRMRESQRSAKARMQNKIKSKKYHKLLKRQKLQEQVKEFEILQKTNPEAALEKLNALEKNRVLERASLRHKNTGSWAKSLQIRAKYDRDVRKDLAEQLQLSRQLTQKQDDEESDENNEFNTEPKLIDKDENDANYDPLNPWTKTNTNDKDEIKTDNNENWRKYWLERNLNEKLLAKYKNELTESKENIDSVVKKMENATPISDKNEAANEQVRTKSNIKEKGNKRKKIKKLKTNKKPIKIDNGWVVEDADNLVEQKKMKKDNKNIDEIFDEKEDEIKAILNTKLKLLSKEGQKLQKPKTSKRKPTKDKDNLKNLKDLTFKNDIQRPIIDEELNADDNEEKTNYNAEVIKSKTANNEKKDDKFERNKNVNANSDADTIIDPITIVNLKQNITGFPVLSDAMGDVELDEGLDDEYVAEREKQMTISQAFEDDDVIADFSKDKVNDTEVKGVELDLSMPGWGSWAGAGITETANKNNKKRLLLKLVKEEKRRDENRGNLYINETVSKHTKVHLVSDVPFPFKTVQDYEASIRAPIGRNYVPETAFRMLTRPSVITKKGEIIEPMDESELVKPPRKLRHEVDKRIERAQQGANAVKVK